MAAIVIGGFKVKSYEGTRSHGPEPAGAGGVGVVSSGASVPLAAGDYVALSFMGVVFYGVVVSLKRSRSLENGDEYEFRMLDNRIRLRWGLVYGRWNIETDAAEAYTDPVVEKSSALDEWTGGEVGFDQGVDFAGGIESEMGRPRPLVRDGSATRGKLFGHVRPAYWKGQVVDYSSEPMSARDIIEEAVRGSIGGYGIGFSFHAAQSKPVFNVDCNSCMSLIGFLQRMADAQGLQMTLDGQKTIRFTRKGEGTVVIPSGAVVKSLGNAISSDPTKVLVVGGSRLVQVNNVPLKPDWNRSWERFLAESAWLEEVKTLMSNIGPLPDDMATRASIAARAREITLAEYLVEKSISVDNPADLEEEFTDNGRWGQASRMDLPVWVYLNAIVFKSYRVAEDAMLYGMPIRSLKVRDRLLCAVEIKRVEGGASIVYRKDPVEFYPQSSSYVIARGQPLDLACAEQTEAMIRARNEDMRERWNIIPDFTLDARNHSIVFSSPVFIDGVGDQSIFRYPNRGQGGGLDLSDKVSGESVFLDLMVPNPDYVIEPAEVKAAFVFELGIFAEAFGVGVRWTNHHAPSIEEHLLHGESGFSPDKTEDYGGSLWVPDAPEGGFLEILYDNGQNARQLAADQAEGLTVRSGSEQFGSYERYGAAGAMLTGAIDRIAVRIPSIEAGLVEEVEFAKPRPVRGVLPTRELAERLRNEEAFSGQQELRREVANLRAISRSYQISGSSPGVVNSSWVSMTDLFRKPPGAVDGSVASLPDPLSQYPYRGPDHVGWRAGDLVWQDEKDTPSRRGVRFGGVVVMDSPKVSGQPVKYVSVCRSGSVVMRVATGMGPGCSVFANAGDAFGSGSGAFYIGRISHSEAVPEVDGYETVLARVDLNAPSRGGRFIVSFDPVSSRLYVSPGTVGAVDVLNPAVVVPEYPLLGPKRRLDEVTYFLVRNTSSGGVGTVDPEIESVDVSPDQDYDIKLMFSGTPQVVFEEASSSSAESASSEEESLLLATVNFRQDQGSSALVINTLLQLWESDVLWPSSPSSSSSSSSGGSSDDDGSGNGSSSRGSSSSEGSKDSAIVKSRFSKTGYVAFACLEGTGVWFEDILDVEMPVGCRVVRVPIDPVYLDSVVRGSVVPSFMGNSLGWEFGRVRGGQLILTSRWWRRFIYGDGPLVIRFTGIRNGFLHWRNPEMREDQYHDNNAALRSRYKP